MRILLIFLLCLSVTSEAKINVKFDTGVAEQVMIGQQPNDVATPNIDLNVGVTTTSDIAGIYSNINYEFLCEGDSFPNKEQTDNGTDTKKLELNFGSVSPLRYSSWPVGSKECNLSWSAATVGTKTINGENIEFTVGGFLAELTIVITSLYDTPDYRRSRYANSIFNMLKDPQGGSSCLNSPDLPIYQQ